MQAVLGHLERARARKDLRARLERGYGRDRHVLELERDDVGARQTFERFGVGVVAHVERADGGRRRVSARIQERQLQPHRPPCQPEHPPQLATTQHANAGTEDGRSAGFAIVHRRHRPSAARIRLVEHGLRALFAIRVECLADLRVLVGDDRRGE